MKLHLLDTAESKITCGSTTFGNIVAFIYGFQLNLRNFKKKCFLKLLQRCAQHPKLAGAQELASCTVLLVPSKSNST